MIYLIYLIIIYPPTITTIISTKKKYMLPSSNTTNIYTIGYGCGHCGYYVCNFITYICCCCSSSSSNNNICIYDILDCLCFQWKCNYEYCLLCCAGCYNGYSHNKSTNVSIHNSIIVHTDTTQTTTV